MSERDALAAGLRILGAWLLLDGILDAPELWHVRHLPPDLGIPEVIVVALKLLVGLRLVSRGGRLASWVVQRDPS